MQPVPNLREVFRLTITTLAGVQTKFLDGSLSSLMRFAASEFGQSFPSYDAVRRALNKRGAWCEYVSKDEDIKDESALPQRVDIVKTSLLLLAK